MSQEIVRKIWGTSECLISTPMLQLHRINFVRGGTCSEHYHRARYNAFYVLSGRLLIRTKHYGGKWREETRVAGDVLVIPPGVVHQFEGLTEGAALEMYYPGEVSEHDIVRLTQGFLK